MSTVKYTEVSYNEMINLSQKDQAKLIKKYEPLTAKITHQFVQKTKLPWDVIKSMAYEGLVLAFKNYDPKRSELTFLQFAGYSIRNTILTSIYDESRTVKMNQYNVAQATEQGLPTYNVVNFDKYLNDDEEDSKHIEIKFNLYENEKFSCGDIYKYLYYRIEQKFKQRDCEMFYKVFGLKGFEDEKGQDVAKFYGVSNGLVSQKIKLIIDFIKSDENLFEMLSQLLEK